MLEVLAELATIFSFCATIALLFDAREQRQRERELAHKLMAHQMIEQYDTDAFHRATSNAVDFFEKKNGRCSSDWLSVAAAIRLMTDCSSRPQNKFPGPH